MKFYAIHLNVNLIQKFVIILLIVTKKKNAKKVFKNFIVSPRCKNDEFRCSTNLCISKNKICDGKNDCGDSSDEIDCKCIHL